ncbi:B12-binding domain-containing protein [Marivita sp. S0852]|uniref:cobalamin B12-binding domain-containing protein n=1 Tax=Marivita sp. S0852 TaxID=3373893 RepID=UPI003981981C
MMSFDLPHPVRATDDAGHGQDHHPRNGDLLVLAEDVIDRLSHIAEHSSLVPHGLEVEGFCIALLEPSAEEAKLILLRARENGATYHDLCINHIGTAARLLGDWWDHDIVTFQELTVAAGRLLHFLRDLRDILPESPYRNERHILIATAPNEQHTIGATIATDLLRQKGWEVDLQIGRSEEDICRMAHRGAYPIVAISASGPRRLSDLTRTVVGLRIAAPRARIFVSGHIVETNPDIAQKVGADISATDYDSGYKALEQLAKSLQVVVPFRA